MTTKTRTATPSRAGASRTRRWTCAGCEVTVRYAASAKAAPRRPEGWTKRGGQWLCLHCQREKAVEKATEKIGGDAGATPNCRANHPEAKSKRAPTTVS